VTSTSAVCTVCARPSEQRLCSPDCVRAAVHERKRNVQHLRTLQRTGGDDAGADLLGRNAELTGALLAERPRGTARAGAEAPGDPATSGGSPGVAEAPTERFAWPGAPLPGAAAG
jgi:hypothetical protein